MNAPTSSVDLIFEFVPLTVIAPSATAVQEARRRHYSAAALEELATSMRENGILQPIVVRPLQSAKRPEDALAKYELVAGERRWRAAEIAGLAHIPARIVELTDAQVLQAQMVENLQREALDTLAEAAGYRALLDSGVKVEVLADLVGKSRSYVYARVKLLELAPAVTDALAKREIDASQALLFARIPSAKAQESALNTLRSWLYQGRGETLSFRRTAELLADKAKNVFIPLATAPFDPADETFFAFAPKDKRGAQAANPLPACGSCPKRSGNDAELAAALESPDVCTDPECYGMKAKQAGARRKATIEASGQVVLGGDEAAAILPTSFGSRGYVDLDEPCPDDELPDPEPDIDDQVAHDAWDAKWERWESRTYRQLLGVGGLVGLEIVYAADPKHKGRIRELAADKEVMKRLKAQGIKLRIFRDSRPAPKPSKPEDPAKAARRREKEAAELAECAREEEIEVEYRRRLFRAMHEACKPPFKRDELELVVEYVSQQCGAPEPTWELFGQKFKASTASDRDLHRFLVMSAIGSIVERDDERAIQAAAKRFKVDAKRIRREIADKFKPKAAK